MKEGHNQNRLKFYWFSKKGRVFKNFKVGEQDILLFVKCVNLLYRNTLNSDRVGSNPGRVESVSSSKKQAKFFASKRIRIYICMQLFVS